MFHATNHKLLITYLYRQTIAVDFYTQYVIEFVQKMQKFSNKIQILRFENDKI
jgi:hypothetical protein